MDELNEYFEPLLKPSDVSKWLNVSVSTIYKWAETGYIPTVDLGGKIRGPLEICQSGSCPMVQKKVKTWKEYAKPQC
jgi:excisionase family DNA binding protein